MLWSRKSITIFHNRSREDIVYLDATGSILKRSKNSEGPFYVYELVVRNPKKGSSQFPVATFVTCDHTTASVLYFLSAFQTDHTKQYGKNTTPLMIICDGSLVLMQAITMVFSETNLQALLQSYYNILTGKGTAQDFGHPVLHRCLSHIMKNAKTLCKKHAPKNYKLAMHVFGLLTSATSITEFDEMLLSCTVIFSSPCSSENVQKHFDNIQTMLTSIDDSAADDINIAPYDLEDIFSPTPFEEEHFMDIIKRAPVDQEGEPNPYHSETFISSLAKYFLPQAALWSSMMFGDLGRHGEGLPYRQFSKKFAKISMKKNQNFTQDNKTQGVMEKSQWDLKKIRFNRRRLTRMDDFVTIYKKTHKALLREYYDSVRQTKSKTEHRVLKEKWRQQKQNRRGVYVTSIKHPFHFRKTKTVVTGPQTITTAPTTDNSVSVAAPDLKDKDPVIVGAHGLKVTAGPQTTTAAPTTDDSASVAAPDLKDKDPVSVDAHGLKTWKTRK